MLLRPAAVQRHHIRRKRGLQRREAIELIQHDIGHCVALELDHHAVAVAVKLIAHVGNALDALFAHQFRDALLQDRFIHLIGNFRDDQCVPVLSDRLDMDLAATTDRAPTADKRNGCPRVP